VRLLIVPSRNVLPLALRPLRAATPRFGEERRSVSLGRVRQAKVARPWLLLAGLGSLAGLVACDVNVHNGKASVRLFSAEATDEWTHRYPLAADGRVEIININGPITVSPGAAGTVEVHATISAKALTEAGAREILAKGSILETTEPSRVRVETMSPRGIRGSYEVRYDVRVPADAQADISVTNGPLKADGLNGRLKATAVNGNVDLTNMSGAIDGVTANGSLVVELTRVAADVRLELTNGRLSLDLPRASKAQLSARVVNGALEVSGLPIQEATGRRIRSLEATLNGGGPSIDLRATNGRLSITGR
jgi:hypothetical protein